MKRLLYVAVIILSIVRLTACSQAEKGSQMNKSNSSANQTSSTETGVELGQIESNKTDLSKEDQEAIIARYEELQQALINQNISKLKQLLPDDYIAVHITGRRQTKEEWLKDIENGDMRYFHFTDLHYSFSQEGNRVQLGIRQRITANIYGSEGTWSIPGTRVFEKRGGEWQIVG
ncbi:hypothetical protein D8824_00985 [Streptococcus intermedius]|uniref:nuclear transport factor 2 family protein n=1 Tax=Streptococcus intermedius TaxID=1338 RepID=UPI000564F9B1|nr:nuclear transport factor 2 family protein [Streptococcus intermedius]RSJ11358.1 hypothetical protein D8833_00975 [Streptococcus intermedius]RSJ17477.1 hypothetical protein D8831_00985 [Streptococcus intermedius]RSJ32652.1 hypothetical protein D8824_00985 [Streptococcus intermedius]